jgi:trehalose-phosphatase
MKNLFDNISEVEEKIQKAGGAILLFDFDGVLSAIAPTPDASIITEEYAALLKQCAARFPVAIITGRKMSEVKEKISSDDFFYMANHGLEWEEDGKDHTKPVPAETVETIKTAKEKVGLLLDRYPGMLLEDKLFSIVVHYRLIQPELIPAFTEEVESLLKPFTKTRKLRLDHSIMNFELRPEIDWDKGDSALFATEHLRKKTGKSLVPIYLGDAQTDEDAFEALQKGGISIRVNSSENKGIKSAAEYCLKDQEEVGRFMKWILTL